MFTSLRDQASNSTNNTIRVSVKKHLKIFLEFFRKYKDALGMLKRSRTNMESMSAAVLFIPDQSEITHLETADYRQYIRLYTGSREFRASDQFFRLQFLFLMS